LAENTGIFIACNVGDQGLIDDLLRQFMDRYYPANPENSTSPVAVAPPVPSARFAGSYRLNRYSHRTLEKLGTLLHEWEVFPGNNGGITLLNPNIGPQNYVPSAPLLFRREGAQDEIAFRQDERGQITRLFVGRYVLEKLPWYALAYGLPFSIGLLLCIPLITTAATPIVLWQAFRAWQTRSGSPLSRTFYSLVAFGAVCFVPFLVYWNLLGFPY
jgi:hypothetical protein